MSVTMFPTYASMDLWTSAIGNQATIVACREAEEIGSNCSISGGASVTEGRLIDLLEETGNDDYGQIGPDQISFGTVLKLVKTAESMVVTGTAPSGSPSVDSRGGIRITWRNGEKEIRLICSPDNPRSVYLYLEGPNMEAEIQEAATGQTLSDSFSWLTQSTRTASGR
jgi:hypothetical protein